MASRRKKSQIRGSGPYLCQAPECEVRVEIAGRYCCGICMTRSLSL